MSGSVLSGPDLTTKFEVSSICGYTFIEKLGSGSFGKVYLATNEKKDKFAVKLETNVIETGSTRLLKENQVYCLLAGGVGIPRVHWFGNEHDCSVLVMDVLGPSLDDLFKLCSRRFTLKTVLMLAEQLLNRIEYLHSKCFVHRDIKPANFVMGPGHFDHIVYMIDFGLSERYCDCSMQHLPNRSRYGIGTPLFSSTNTHFRMTPSRRDDLESLGYMLIFFLKGTLPWEGMKGKKASQTWEMIAEKKLGTSIEDLCMECPKEFSFFLQYCRKLEYAETPDYEALRSLFKVVAKRLELEYDCEFDWVRLRKQQLAEEAAEAAAAAEKTVEPELPSPPPTSEVETCSSDFEGRMNDLSLD